jgi:hypothetical protein
MGLTPGDRFDSSVVVGLIGSGLEPSHVVAHAA